MNTHSYINVSVNLFKFINVLSKFTNCAYKTTEDKSI